MLFLVAITLHFRSAKGATAAGLLYGRCHRFRTHYFCSATLSHSFLL
jgi:hypothetical protein